MTLAELQRVASSLDISLRLVASWQGGDLDRLLSARHAALHEALARMLHALDGWELAPEVSYSVFGERGIIDGLAWHAATHTVLVIELKTELVDISQLMGSVDQKRRLAPGIAAARGWQPRHVAVWVVIGDSSTNRRRVRQHRTVLRSAFPTDGRAMAGWLARPVGAVSALSFWSSARGDDPNQRFATVKRVRRPAPRGA